MDAIEPVTSKAIQQAVIEKLALLSLSQQKEALAFIERMAHRDAPRSQFRAMFEEATKDVPPEAWDEVPTDGALNHDHYLYGAPKKYDEHGNPLQYEKLG
jgi:hypothetical protein